MHKENIYKTQDQYELKRLKEAIDQFAIVAVTDINGTIIEVNDKFCEISKYNREELIGKNHRIVNSNYHPPEFFANMWKTITSGNKWEGEIRNQSKDGSFYWVKTIIVPFKNQNGEIKQFLSIRNDITQQKENEFNLRNMIDATFEGLLIYNLSGKIVWCNATTQQMLNLKQDQIIEAFISEVFGEKFEIFMLGHSSINLKINRQEKIFDIVTKSYFYKGHRSFLVAIRDVSEKEQLQAQILQQDRLASIGLLASGLAHEIGTPLGIMRGRAELMSAKTEDKEFVYNGLQTCIKQIDRISTLIGSLLTLARGSTDTKVTSVNVSQVVEDVKNFISYETRKNNITIANNVSSDIAVQAVAAPLYQVLLNLFVNAIHAIEEKRKNTNIFPGEIVVNTKIDSNTVFIEVIDNGCGISEENLKKIFAPFFTTKDVGKGTGLGLATSLKILRSWGGTITAQSEVGNGTKFILELKSAK